MAAVDYFLKVGGIEGEASCDKHKGEIDVASFSFGVSQMGSHGAGTGGGTGKAHFTDLNIHTKVNKGSPKVFLGCAVGEHYKKAVLTVRKAGKEQQEYMKVTLT